MTSFSNRDKEILSDANNLARQRVTAIGSDGYGHTEPFPRESFLPANLIMRHTPDGYNDGGGLIQPNYDDYPIEGAIGTRRILTRLHSYIPSGITGPNSCQAFFAVSAAPASNSVVDLDAVRIKPLISSAYSPRKTNAANADTYIRGFELALYPAQSAGLGNPLVADTTNGPISPLADPGAASSADTGAGVSSEGLWYVDYESGAVRFSRPPLNGSTGVMNPNNVFGDINGNEVASGGTITMFATYYEYTGELGYQDDPDLVTVGDGYVSFGQFTGEGFNVAQAAVDFLPDEGGTVFIKEGNYDYIDSVSIPEKVNVVGFNGVTITRPRREPAFVIAGDRSGVENVEVQSRDGVTHGGCIELRNTDFNNDPEELVDLAINGLEGIAVDPAGGKMYFTDSVSNRVMRANLDGSEQEVLFSQFGSLVPTGIALDVNAGKLYICNSGQFRIERANLDGTNRETVVTPINNAWSIALDINGGKIYWNEDNGINGDIFRANFDGTGAETVYSSPSETIYSCAIDPIDKKVYFNQFGKMRRVNFDGTDVQTIIDDPAVFTATGYMAIDIYAKKLYWTNDQYNLIQRSNFDGSKVENLFAPLADKPTGIAIDTSGGETVYWTSVLVNKIHRGVISKTFNQVTLKNNILHCENDGYGIAFAPEYSARCNYVGLNITNNIFKSSSYNPTYIGEFSRGDKSRIDGYVSARGMVIDNNDFRPSSHSADGGHPNAIRFEHGGLVLTNINETSITNNNAKYANIHIDIGTSIEDITISNNRFNDIYINGELIRPTLVGNNVITSNLKSTSLYITDGRVRTEQPRNFIVTSEEPSEVNVNIYAEDIITVNANQPDSLVLDVTAGKIYYIFNNTLVGRANLDGSDKETLFSLSGSPGRQMAIDFAEEKVYYTLISGSRIRRRNLDGTDVEDLVIGQTSPEALSLDLANGKVYWVTNYNTLWRANLNGSNPEALIDSLVSSTSTALDVDDGKIYFIDNDNIKRANLDGSDVEQVVSGTFVSWIDLDTIAGKVYWSEQPTGDERIKRVNLDGSNVETLLTPEGGLFLPANVAVDAMAGMLYWSDTTTNKIARAPIPRVSGIGGMGRSTGGVGITGAGDSGIVVTGNTVGVKGIGYSGSGVMGVGSTGVTGVGRYDGTGGSFTGETGVDGYGSMFGLRGTSGHPNTNLVEELLTGLSDPTGIALDVANEKMYWTDPVDDKIYRANLDGTDQEDLITTGTNHPYGIALDLVAKKMYWTDVIDNTIYRANLDGTGKETVVSGLGDPAGITLDISAGKIYYTDPGAGKDHIRRANLDGSEVEDLVTGLPNTIGIALDLTAGKMYWVDTTDDSVQRANLDGSEIEILWVASSSSNPYFIALDTAAGKMYWTDFTQDVIRRSNLDGSEVEILLSFSGATDPLGIALDLTNGMMYWTEDSKIRRAPIGKSIGVDGLSKSVSGIGVRGTGDTGVLGIGTGGTVGVKGIIDGYESGIGVVGIGNVRGDGGQFTGGVVGVSGVGIKPDIFVEKLINWGTSNPRHATVDATDGKIYWADSGFPGIVRSNLDGSNRQHLFVGGSPNDMALDLTARKVYFSFTGNRIRRMNLDGSSLEDVINFSFWQPTGIALDIAAGKIYFSRPAGNRIQRANLDGSDIGDVILTPDAGNLALDTAAGKIYWVENDTEIKRAPIDGAGNDDIETLITVSGISAFGIGLDTVVGKIYWLNDTGVSLTSSIQRANLDGTDVETLVAGLRNPFDLYLDTIDGKVYWTDFDDNAIYRASIGRSTGVDGASESTVGVGVKGTGYIGIVGEGDSVGVKGISGSETGIGVIGVGGRDGYYGGQFTGGLGGLSAISTNNYGTGIDGYGNQFGVKGVGGSPKIFAEHITSDTGVARGMGLDLVEGKAYFGGNTADGVRRVNLDGSNVEVVVPGSGSTFVRIDSTNRKMYWNDLGTPGIRQAGLDGSNIVTVITGNIGDLKLDVAGGKMYYVVSNDLRRANLDGTGQETLVTLGFFSNLGDIALDLFERKIYWADTGAGNPPIIQRSNLDGSNIENVFAVQASNLVIDSINRKIYYLDISGIYYRADFDGSNIEYITNLYAINDAEIDHTNQIIYFSTNGSVPLDIPAGIYRASTGISTGVDGTSKSSLGVGVRGTGYVGVKGIGDEHGVGVLGVSTNIDSPGIKGLGTYSGISGIGSNPTVFAKDLIDGLAAPYDIAIDTDDEKIYWTDTAIPNKIQRARIDGGGVETLIGSGISSTGAIALDLIARKMYWIETASPYYVKRANLDGSNIEILITDFGAINPSALAVDAVGGKLYFVSQPGTGDIIYRANLDGSNIEHFISGLRYSGRMAVNNITGKLYWFEHAAGGGTPVDIKQANLSDGSDIEILLYQLADPNGMALDNVAGKIYWTDDGNNRIQRANLSDGSEIEDVVTEVQTARNMALDVSAGKMYWINETDDKIQWASTGVSIGVDGTTKSPTGIGVRGTGDTGVLGIGDTAGVKGIGDGYGAGIIGISGLYSTGIIGVGGAASTGVEDASPAPLPGPRGIALDIAAGKIYFTDLVDDIVYRMDLDGGNIESLVSTGNGTVQDIALDINDGRMYWSNLGSDYIRRANLDGSDAIDWLSTTNPGGLAIDPAGGKIYWAADSGAFKRADLGTGGNVITTTISDGDIMDIALDIAAGKMYWTDNDTHRVQRANLDGSDIEDLAFTEPGDPWGLDLDIAAGKIYWVERVTNRLRRANLDGSNVELVALGLDEPRHMALDTEAGKAYWVEAGARNRIKKISIGKSIGVDGVSNSAAGMGVRGTGEIGVLGVGTTGVRGVSDGYGAGVVGIGGPRGAGGQFVGGGTGSGVKGTGSRPSTAVELLVPIPLWPWDVALDVDGGKMYFTSDGAEEICRSDLDGSNVEVLITSATDPRYIDLDLTNRKMYWVQRTGSNRIRRANLDGSSPQDVVTGLNDPIGIALDVDKNRIYWSETGSDEINRAELDGTNPTAFLTSLNNPEGVALDLIARKIYWCNNASQTIERANLNGTNNNKETVMSGLDGPSGIALDGYNGKIYFSEDGSYDDIKRANLDGSDIESLGFLFVGTGATSSQGIALDNKNGLIYYAGIQSVHAGIYRGPMGRTTGVYGVSEAPAGIGVSGFGDTGISGISTGRGAGVFAVPGEGPAIIVRPSIEPSLPIKGGIYAHTDTGRLSQANGAGWERVVGQHHARILDADDDTRTTTGDFATTVDIPANTLRDKSIIRITTGWKIISSTGTQTLSTKVGALTCADATYGNPTGDVMNHCWVYVEDLGDGTFSIRTIGQGIHDQGDGSNSTVADLGGSFSFSSALTVSWAVSVGTAVDVDLRQIIIDIT
jgi:low density lipoprotein receptor-related protein 5/6